jgi:hypothetical protein
MHVERMHKIDMTGETSNIVKTGIAFICEIGINKFIPLIKVNLISS